MTTPASIQSDGNLRVTWVPAIVNTAAPTLAELNAAGSVDLSYYLTPDGYNTGGDEASVIDDRLASTQTYERPGRTSETLDLMYVYRAQEPAAATNKAFSTLVPLTIGFIVSRWGLDADTAFAAAQRVDVLPVQCGVQRKAAPEMNSILKISQKVFVTGEMKRDVAIV